MTDSSVSNSEDFLSALTKRFPTANTAYTIVMTGQFKEVTISSKPANNTRPYDEIMADQPYFTKENIFRIKNKEKKLPESSGEVKTVEKCKTQIIQNNNSSNFNEAVNVNLD